MPNDRRAVLALNAGSSSVKFALYQPGAASAPSLLSKGEIEDLGGTPHLTAQDGAGAALTDQRLPATGHEAVLAGLLSWVDAHLGTGTLAAAGHRVVHGGQAFTAPVQATPEVIEALEKLTPLAPLHQPHSLSPIRALAALRPGLPQVACFDTAFHRTMPEVATRLALPRAYAAEGVRRYGFHGLSYEYIAQTLRSTAPGLAAGRVVVAHLGSGASLCAMRGGRSLDTTMGFTALDGLVMGTRCGTLDPGVLLYMLQQKGLSPHQVEDVLYRQSGLLGVSGISNDMRALLASPAPAAREAVELFVFRIARETAAMAASLGGLDGFIFTGGIGEHAAEIRTMVGERLAWMGPLDIRMIPTDEELMIARHTIQVLGW